MLVDNSARPSASRRTPRSRGQPRSGSRSRVPAARRNLDCRLVAGISSEPFDDRQGDLDTKPERRRFAGFPRLGRLLRRRVARDRRRRRPPSRRPRTAARVGEQEHAAASGGAPASQSHARRSVPAAFAMVCTSAGGVDGAIVNGFNPAAGANWVSDGATRPARRTPAHAVNANLRTTSPGDRPGSPRRRATPARLPPGASSRGCWRRPPARHTR